jgi:hypothetical protein
VYTIYKRFSSDKQDISRDIFFLEFQLHDVYTGSVRTSGHRTSSCLFLISQGALLAQRLEVYALHGVLNSLRLALPSESASRLGSGSVTMMLLLSSGRYKTRFYLSFRTLKDYGGSFRIWMEQKKG